MILQILSVLSLIGTWQYVGFRFEGNFYPNPNPKLVVEFRFEENGTSNLRWQEKGEDKFCERRADYALNGDVLWQKVTWVHPENDLFCMRDPDMQLGGESWTRIIFEQELLGLVLSLKGEELIYLMKPSGVDLD